MPDPGESDFKWRRFQGEIILWAVRCYCRDRISYRDLAEMMAERGVEVDHTNIYRWVQRFAPEIEHRSWKVDETYGRVKGRWACLYRAVTGDRRTVDFFLSRTRNAKAAKRVLGKALRAFKAWERLVVVNTDKAGCYVQAIRELKQEGLMPTETRHRQVRYLNNRVEAEHGKFRRVIRPTLGFKSMKTAYGTLRGFEVMRALNKGQGALWQCQDGIHGEVRLVEGAFGLGPSGLAEAITMLDNHLRQQAA